MLDIVTNLDAYVSKFHCGHINCFNSIKYVCLYLFLFVLFGYSTIYGNLSDLYIGSC